MPTIEHHYGAYLIKSGRHSELVQTDWEYPATAERFGWSLRRVQRRNGETRHLARYVKGCEHRGTDGTVTCSDCGITASEFIRAAAEYLDSKC